MPIDYHNPEDNTTPHESMENGDIWYFDEFGEYRNVSASDLEAEDLTSPPDDVLDQDEFGETLRSEYIEDQLNDPNLQTQAELDYENTDKRSLGEKIKDKFDDLTH